MGGGDGNEDGSSGALRNSPRPHRRPVVPRRRLAAAELLLGYPQSIDLRLDYIEELLTTLFHYQNLVLEAQLRSPPQ